jgi:hypothetical protein
VHQLNKLLPNVVPQVLEHVGIGPYGVVFGFSVRSTADIMTNSLNVPHVSIYNKACSWRHHRQPNWRPCMTLVAQAEGSMSYVMFEGLSHWQLVTLMARLLLLKLVNNNTSNDNSCRNPLEVLDNNRARDYHLTKVFFCESGSVNVKVVMKMVFQY